MSTEVEKIQSLRQRTGLPVVDLQKALHEADGDETKALEHLQRKGVAVAEKRANRVTAQGIITSYVHGSRLGALIELNCETDFVAKTDDFHHLAKEIAMQVASMNPESVEALLEQPFMRDPEKTVKDLITEVIAKTGENIRVSHIARFELGQA